MPDPWLGRALLTTSFVCSVWGFASIATAMQAHWHQVTGSEAAGRRTVVVLRVLGALALGASLLLCLLAVHPSMASLVWVMLLAAAALVIALVLSWRPRLLAPLVKFAGAGTRDPPSAGT